MSLMFREILYRSQGSRVKIACDVTFWSQFKRVHELASTNVFVNMN